jgi:hypothetical protein
MSCRARLPACHTKPNLEIATLELRGRGRLVEAAAIEMN